MKNIQNPNAYRKGSTDVCRQTLPPPQNGHVLPQMIFRNFFRKYRFFRKTYLIIKYPVSISR